MEKWWSSVGSVMAVIAILRAYLPRQLCSELHRLCRKVIAYFSNNVDTTVQEFSDGGAANELFASVQLYLSALSNCSSTKRLIAFLPKNSSKIALNMGKSESVQDSYRGVTLSWQFATSRQKTRAASSYSWRQQEEEEVPKFVLRIHRRHRSTLLQPYLDHIMERAKNMMRENKQRSLFTNISGGGSSRGKSWVPVPFKHPASFQTLALDSDLKRSIIDDLTEFTKGGEFYKRAGRAWKRGYLLYGPPGTGKTTMVAAIANFLGYDVYDLELTQVKSNSQLRQLLLSTTDKSVIVVEDIDCSLDLSERSEKKRLTAQGQVVEDSKSEESKINEVTLSGLLNFTDGILSCCSRERIIVFTTNHVEKLDPALLRSGRMDMHINLSFCTFDGVKVLIRNYLQIEDHPLFPAIELAIASAKMSPAAASEVLIMERRNPEAALQALLLALEENKKQQQTPLVSQKEGEDEGCGEKIEG